MWLNSCTCFVVLPGCFKCCQVRIKEHLHLFWCAARLFQVLLKEIQVVAQLLHLFLCAARLFELLLNENERVALVFLCCQALSSVVK